MERTSCVDKSKREDQYPQEMTAKQKKTKKEQKRTKKQQKSRLFDRLAVRRTAGSNRPNGPIGAPIAPCQTAPRPQKMRGNTFRHPIWSPRPIFDLPGPRKIFRFLTEKVDFLTVWLCSVQQAQTGQTGPLGRQLDPARPRPDLKKCAETLLDPQYGPPESYLPFLDPGIFFDF